jgi:hypothetical protein
LVNNKIVLEFKNLRTGFHPSNYVQIVNYLKHWDIQLGILINFGQNRLQYERIPFSKTEVLVNVMPDIRQIPAKSQVSAISLIRSVEKIMNDVGYGYGVETFSGLLFVALQHQEVNVARLVVNPVCRGLKLGAREVNCFLLNDEILAAVCATGKIGSASDLATMKSYIKHSCIPFGILVDIGSRTIEFKIVT